MLGFQIWRLRRGAALIAIAVIGLITIRGVSSDEYRQSGTGNSNLHINPAFQCRKAGISCWAFVFWRLRRGSCRGSALWFKNQF